MVKLKVKVAPVHAMKLIWLLAFLNLSLDGGERSNESPVSFITRKKNYGCLFNRRASGLQRRIEDSKMPLAQPVTYFYYLKLTYSTDTTPQYSNICNRVTNAHR